VKDEEKAKQEEKDQKTDFLKGKYIKDLSSEEVAWMCEFCGVHNRVPKNVEKPKATDELYLLKKAQTTKPVAEEEKKETADKVDSEDDTSLIFCVDVSGSMDEKHQVTQDNKKNYVARIKLIKDAVIKQIEDMKKTHPNRKIGLVTFDDRITLYGDCNMPKVPVQVSIDDFDNLLDFSRTQKESIMRKTLSESFNQVSTAIKSLKPDNCTALGPGLLCSLGLIQVLSRYFLYKLTFFRGHPGSRVILCTDGLANRGLGSLGSGDLSNASRAFYERLGDIAVDNGVSISIITIQGNACRVDALGPLTDRTGGTILRVDPTNMDLSEMASNSLIATNVSLKAILHEGLAFEHEDSAHLHNNKSILEKKVGSVSENNEAYFEYRVKGLKDLQEAGVNLDETKSIPLQSQITYTDLKGNEFVRIISKQQELTKDQEEAQKEVKAAILTNYVQKQSANLVLNGKVGEAKKKKAQWSSYITKVAQNKEVNVENKKAFREFEAENEQLEQLILETEAQTKSTSIAKKDEVASKLYKIKQFKKK
jgi:hypothetical protein